MGKLVAGLLVVSGEMERWLRVPLDQGEAGLRAVIEGDQTGAMRITCALLLRKARLHVTAVLRADKTSNVHSLGVQMRPVLECAGQVALFVRNSMLEPDEGFEKVVAYLDADYYQTTIRATKGGVGHEELLAHLARVRRETEESARRVTGDEPRAVAKAKLRRFGRLRQIDKVGELFGGDNWYRYLSEHFCHGRPDGVRASWQGGVTSANTVQDELACAGMMDYLANQLAVLLFYAALCPADGEVEEDRSQAALSQLEAVRNKTKELREWALSAVRTTDAGCDNE